MRIAGKLPLAVLLTLGVWGAPGAARADDLTLKPGQEVALALDGAMALGSVASIIGNAVTLGRPNPGWIVSGYIIGTLNLVISPLLLVYGQDPSPALGLGLGAVHGVLGITNLGLAIAGGVRYRRLHRQETKVAVAPLLARDARGGSLVGTAVAFSY